MTIAASCIDFPECLTRLIDLRAQHGWDVTFVASTFVVELIYQTSNDVLATGVSLIQYLVCL